MNNILLIHIISCAAMTGVIWLVQLLIYPTLSLIDCRDFAKIHRFHTFRISWVVAPLMLTEIISAFLLVFITSAIIYKLNLAFLLLIWLSTAFVSVPIHNLLSAQNESKNLCHRLVLTNWPRTVLWTGRLAALVFYQSNFGS